MTDRSPPTNLTLAHALRLARAGFLVFPCRKGDKRPATNNGLLDATTDEATIRTWFNNDRGLNLAVACGPQPNGINLLAIDIDPKNGGDEAWANLINGHTLPPCPTHTTPSGGMHLFFNAPSTLHNTSGRLGPGIDTRGGGGYVVVPPSKLINKDTGEMTHYVTKREVALAEMAAPSLLDWLDLGDEQAESIARHPSQQPIIDLGDSPADLLRTRWVWEIELDRDGWTAVRGGPSNEQRWTRPDKSSREGHSATLHLPDGPLVVWTTERPAGGRTNSDGSSSFSPYDYAKAYRFGGDDKATVAWIRGVLTTVAPTDRGGRTTPVDATDDATPSANLPPDFWAQRPILEHIRTAAEASMCSPDALLVNVLCRCATLIPPCWKLPGTEQGVFGKPATFDLIGCVLAETSGGKSLAGGVAEMLVPGFDEDDDYSMKPPRYAQYGFDLPIGSGEGLVQWFMVPRWAMDSEGEWKQLKGQVQGRTGLFLAVDEGTGFTNQADRKGTTIVATVASAFSGSTLGQLNAKDETNRLLRGGKARICLVINMQESNAHLLYAPELEAVGFTGRLLFASAHNPHAPRPADRPKWPGLLGWTPPPSGFIADQFFTYDDEIIDEILMTRYQSLTGALEIDKRQSQHLVLRCKVGSILAAWEGRDHQTTEDWSIAGQILGGSTAMLRRAEAFQSKIIETNLMIRGQQRDIVNGAADMARIRRLAVGWRAEALTLIRKHGPLPWKRLRDITESGEMRVAWRRELDAMVDEGILVLTGARYSIA